jgi:5-methyltetrahydrofolate--homocysteine methyltransferase
MKVESFIGVGENIHCTRIFKVGGKFCRETADGAYAVHYMADGEERQLPVPSHFVDSPDWESGKVKHCAVAIWQGNYGDDAARAAGVDYLETLARKQEAAGANYLDINVDEFSTDVEERVRFMKWTVDVVQSAVAIPVSIDSSNPDILRAGLEAADKSRGKPMVNSVSLERKELIAVSCEQGAVVIASAAGESGLPSTVDERMANFAALMPLLRDAGFELGEIHLDPLVLPISVDGTNGVGFLDSCRAVRDTYGSDVHCVAGLSNVSFGMPNRKLINQVFAYLAVEAGADGGIVDPMQINAGILSGLDPADEQFELARALLMGEDDFGMNYITAMRS